MTKVYFSNSYGILREIVNFDETEDEQVAFDCINAFVESKNYKSYYSRVWKQNGKTIVDVGSHTEHFEIDWRTDDLRTYSIFKEIEKTSGKNDKVAIISQHKEDETFKRYLKFLYDETIVTGLSTKKINKKVDIKIENKPESVIEVLDYLEEHNTGSDKDIAFVQSYINSLVFQSGMTEKERHNIYVKFLKELFTKTYKCGITASSVNRAIPSLIHEFKVQLAFSFEKYEDKIEEYYLTQKLDGHRTLIHIDSKNDKIIFRTRKGHQIFGLDEIENEIRENYLSKVVADVNFIFDGEITVVNTDITDVFNATSKIITKKDDKQKVGLKFNWFDFIPYDEFLQGKSKEPYKNRRFAIDNMFENTFEHTPKFFVNVPVLYHGTEKTEIAKWSNWATKNGYEGIMLNTAEGFYETKRTSGLLKVKKFHSCDGIVKGMYEGTGKYVGMLGGINITFEDQVVNIGSGFSDEERRLYWDNPELIIGKVCEYQYFEKTENQNGGTDLRFATWKRNIREDKTEEDVNYE